MEEYVIFWASIIWPNKGWAIKNLWDKSIKEIKKSIKSLEKQIKKHKDKLEKYIKTPDKYDNKGFLKNAWDNIDLRNKKINKRINHLKHEIKTWENEIQALKSLIN